MGDASLRKLELTGQCGNIFLGLVVGSKFRFGTKSELEILRRVRKVREHVFRTDK